jgi:hypothetical protein
LLAATKTIPVRERFSSVPPNRGVIPQMSFHTLRNVHDSIIEAKRSKNMIVEPFLQWHFATKQKEQRTPFPAGKHN